MSLYYQAISEAKSIDFLANQGLAPPNGRVCVDNIRKKGNEATHEIALMANVDASNLINFSKRFLNFIYKLPSAISTPSYVDTFGSE